MEKVEINTLLNRAGKISDLVSTHSVTLNFTDSLIVLIISTILGFYLRYLFGKFSNTYSSKLAFGNTILIVTLSVASIIAIVKSSLALSLGLVGALSVIRFRTAVKEPYNLAFLLLSICIGIGIGSFQFTFVFLLVVVSTVIVIFLYRDRTKSSRLLLNSTTEDLDTLSLTLDSKISLDDVSRILEENCDYFKIISWDIEGDRMNIVVRVRISEQGSLIKIQEVIKAKFLDSILNFYSSPNS